MGNINVGWLRSNVGFVKGGLNAKYSVTKIWRTVFKERPGIRKTDFFATMRYFKGEDEKARDSWKSTPLKYKPAESQLGKAPFQLHKNFLVEYDIFGADSVTGEKLTFTGRIGFDELQNRGDIEDIIKDTAESEEVLDYWRWIKHRVLVDKIENVKVYYK